MARVVAHSRNTALPFALSSAGHDVVLVDVESDVRWAEYTAFAEVIVLECDEPEACASFVAGIKASAQNADHEVRVLLLAGEASSETGVAGQDGVFVLHLPLTMTRLNEALDELLQGPALPSSVPHRVIDVRERVPAGVSPASLPGEHPSSRGRRVLAAPPPVEPFRHEPPAPRTISLVRSLTAAVDDLAGVADTAAVVVEEAMNLLACDAATVLVRDGAAGWRVAAGTGLRPREDRLTLSPQHWLVNEAGSTFGVILTGGEGRWPQLYGVPLSWRKNLLALQLPPAAALLVLARDERDFVESDLQSLISLAEEAGQLLCDATDVRKLARLLEPYCDPAD